MDLSDLNQPLPMHAAVRTLGQEPENDEPALELVTQVASEIATPLTSALERVTTLAETGAIDRQGLRALRDELESARRTSMVAQQIARFASGRIRQTQEQLNLTQMLRDALLQRGRETQARGIQLRQVLKPAEVVVDASLLFALLQAVLDWSLEHARTHIEFRIDMKPWPAHARLGCRFGHQPPDLVAEEQRAAAASGSASEALHVRSLDTLSWRLVEHICRIMGLVVERADSVAETALTLEFPRTVNETVEGMTAVELDTGFASTGHSLPLAGNQVLVVASRRDVRNQVRHAIAHMGMIVDFVTSVDDARAFCREGVPHALIYEAALAGEQFEALRGELLSLAPDLVYVEITEQGQSFEVSSFGGAALARVGRDAIISSLPSALMFELSKGL
jgi:hypothetical protein